MYQDTLGIYHDNNGNTICARCGGIAKFVKMSWFNTQMICVNCQKVEERDPRYKQAKEAERQALKMGNYNFRGIGW